MFPGHLQVTCDSYGHIIDRKVTPSCNHQCTKPYIHLIPEQADPFDPRVPTHWVTKLFIDFAVYNNRFFHVTTKHPHRFRATLEAVLNHLDHLDRGRLPALLDTLSTTRDEAIQTAYLNVQDTLRDKVPLPNVFMAIPGNNRDVLHHTLAHAHQFPSQLYTVFIRPLTNPVFIHGSASAPKSSVPIDWVTIDAYVPNAKHAVHAQWIEDIAAQCRMAKIPLWIQSVGTVVVGAQFTTSKKPLAQKLMHKNILRWPPHLRIRQCPSTPPCVKPFYNPTSQRIASFLKRSPKLLAVHLKRIHQETLEDKTPNSGSTNTPQSESPTCGPT
jgi:protein gp37